MTSATTAEEMERNPVWLFACLGQGPATFAYPCSPTPIRGKRMAAQHRGAAHSVMPRLNQSRLGLADLRAVPRPDMRKHREVLAHRIEAAAGKRAWLMLDIHDVRKDPTPHGVTPEDLDWVVPASLAAGFERWPLGELVSAAQAAPRPPRRVAAASAEVSSSVPSASVASQP